jgi:hypothetical protein
MRLLERRIVRRIRPSDEQRLTVELEGRQGAAPVLSALEELGARVEQFQLSDVRGGRELVLTVEFPRETEATAVAGRLSQLESVTGVRWAD